MKSLKIFFAVASIFAANECWAAPTGFEQCQIIKNNVRRLECYDKISPPVALPISSQKPKETTVWEKEPKSFLSVQIDQPLDVSIKAVCPIHSTHEGLFQEIDSYQWEKQGKTPCVFVHSQLATPWAEFKGHGVDGLTRERIRLYGDASLAGQIKAFFISSRYPMLFDALTQRFGPPTVTVSASMKLNNGGELPTSTNTWVGKDSVLAITDLASRETNGGLTNYGELTFTSVKYLKLQNEADNKSTQQEAQKF